MLLYENLTEEIIGAAISVHTALGPGLLESTYDACLDHEFTTAGLHFERQVPLPVVYRDIQLKAGYRLDYFVEKLVIVEIKAVEKTLPIHTAQLLSYLKMTNCRVGLLINFNVVHLRSGIRRVVNG